MTTPNMYDPFFTDIVVVLWGNAWQMNVVNNWFNWSHLIENKSINETLHKI